MGIIGDAAGAALKIGGAIFGGISASKAMKKVKANLNKQKQANEDWYNRRYNEDATQRADAQAILTRTQEIIRDRTRQAQGAQAVMGGTDESVAAEKAANNEALARATADIAINGEARKDDIEAQYQSRDADLDNQLNNLEINKAQAVSQAVSGLSSAASGLGDSIDGLLNRNKA